MEQLIALGLRALLACNHRVLCRLLLAGSCHSRIRQLWVKGVDRALDMEALVAMLERRQISTSQLQKYQDQPREEEVVLKEL